MHENIHCYMYHMHFPQHACRDNKGHWINSPFFTVDEDGQKVSCSTEDNRFLKINIYFISLWYGLHGNCRRNRSQCLIHWRWCGVGEGELLNNYCLFFLLGTQGGGAREKEKKKYFLTAETLTWTDPFGDKDLVFQCHTFHIFTYVQLG